MSFAARLKKAGTDSMKHVSSQFKEAQEQVVAKKEAKAASHQSDKTYQVTLLS